MVAIVVANDHRQRSVAQVYPQLLSSPSVNIISQVSPAGINIPVMSPPGAILTRVPPPPGSIIVVVPPPGAILAKVLHPDTLIAGVPQCSSLRFGGHCSSPNLNFFKLREIQQYRIVVHHITTT